MKCYRYELVVNGVPGWFAASAVGAAYDSGWSKVEFGNWVQDSPESPPRTMTEEDKNEIREAADRHSENK